MCDAPIGKVISVKGDEAVVETPRKNKTTVNTKMVGGAKKGDYLYYSINLAVEKPDRADGRIQWEARRDAHR
ncbi:Uncharacterised protein [uncultured archaeon]|nr:Uncharacterised protein [uncultured archaeon]